MRIKAVLFDLDQTLVDRELSLKRFLAFQWQSRAALQSIDYEVFESRFLALDNNGSLWKDKVYATLIEEFRIRGLDVSDLLTEYLDRFAEFSCLYPEGGDVLLRLKDAGFKLGIITNGRTDLQNAVIQACGLDELMDEILISEAEHVKKPDSDIFNRVTYLFTNKFLYIF